MQGFKLVSDFHPTGDQPAAIKNLTEGLEKGLSDQILLGVTGSGKTFTMANVIANLNLPTLVISHNKTLAAQLYQEFRDFFPENAASYFVSYYDYYQPEAYIAQTDTYIEKETDINQEIDKLRLQATSNLLTRSDTLIVASVSCIYNIGSPKEYGNYVIELNKNAVLDRNEVLEQLVHLQYDRAGYDFRRGTFRVRGDIIDIFPAYKDTAIRVRLLEKGVVSIHQINPLTGEKLADLSEGIVIYPAKHYMMDSEKLEDPFRMIRKDLTKEVDKFKRNNKLLEAQRLLQRVSYDLEMIQEFGYVNGIENYSRYFDGRKPGEAPYTLLDYFTHQYGKQWLLFIDESHMTVPQIRGMYNGDIARKKTLIEFGFRLRAALDNRPLRFAEFLHRVPQTIYVSATPAKWEITRAKKIVEQLVRPTGLVDPSVYIRPTKNQIPDLVGEILLRKKRKERVLVTTLTKKMAEELTRFLNDPSELRELFRTYKSNCKKHITIVSEFLQNNTALPTVQYLHADIETLDRQDILDDLREGKYDVVVGINLLREGLDLPEVSLVAILDADKEGFLRSETSLIQTMGRAARHVRGEVIMYADTVTGSMNRAINEVKRRKKVQIEYNRINKISPKSVTKPIRKKLVKRQREDKKKSVSLFEVNSTQLIPADRKKLIKKIQRNMRAAAKDLDFETAALLRDKISEINSM